MVKQGFPQPTDGELEVLRFLWDNGPSTVKQVHQAINITKSVGYTTTLKVMQKMLVKGLLARDASEFRHIYTASLPEEKTQKQLLANFLDKAFSGSTEKLLMQLLSTSKLSTKEKAIVKKMFNEDERK
ncbi:MAG: BlaI/MecI/CopY family transcriptional regulator [Planctomycetes bacterium]|nr:BlaI/MecI/CopY family transcriptional regulator [Planctomycetota bacterium]